MKKLLFFVEVSWAIFFGHILRPFYPVSAWFFVSVAETLRVLPRRVALLFIPFLDEIGRVMLDRKKPWIKRHRIFSGDVMEFDLTEKAQRHIYSHPVYEHGLAKLFRSVIEEGDYVLDIGANVGYYSMIAASKGAVVHAYEPDKVNFERLARNVSLNDYEFRNVYAWCEAVGAENGVAILHINPHNRGGNTLLGNPPYRVGSKEISREETEKMFEGETLEYQVPVVTVDEILDSHSMNRVKAIKIDVEGFEEKVIEGMTEALKTRKIDYIFCELSKDTREKVPALMKSYGYSCKGITDAGTYTRPTTRDVVFIRS